MTTESKPQYKFIDDIVFGTEKLCGFFWETAKTFIRDCITKKIPGFRLTVVAIALVLAVMCRLDAYVLWRLHLPFIMTGTWIYRLYIVFVAAIPYLAWAVFSQGKRVQFLKNLETAFLSIPLKSATGAVPTYFKEKAIDKDVRSLFLRNPYISIEEFKKKKDQIGSAIKGRVIDIKEHRNDQLVEIKYADHEIQTFVTCVAPDSFKSFGFFVGQGYEQNVKANLLTHPHLLVGGQTGGGKSTFLRQFITTLFLSNMGKIEMTLVDLKEGIEFELFENLPDVQVYSEVADAAARICSLRDNLKERGELLRQSGVKQISELPPAKQLKRHLLVIDEAADIFLNGPGRSSKEILEVRESISLIARKGRATGIHLVIATQKPDSKAVDTHVKSCLAAAVCFPMVDDASSISILGNGRATDLPAIKGRAIWKVGGEQVELQTPMMTDGEARELLKEFKKSSTIAKAKADDSATDAIDPIRRHPNKDEREA